MSNEFIKVSKFYFQSCLNAKPVPGFASEIHPPPEGRGLLSDKLNQRLIQKRLSNLISLLNFSPQKKIAEIRKWIPNFKKKD